MPDTEIANKQRRLGELLQRHGLDGVILQNRNNFAWITGGKDNHIPNNSPTGVTAILATADSRICLANTIESAPRMRTEELAGMGIETIDFPWHDRAATQKRVREVIAGRKIAADVDAFGLGLPGLPDGFDMLRWSLTAEEIARYRDGAARTTRAMESACRAVRPGQDEHEVAGIIDHFAHREGTNPVVTLVAADHRIEQYRHPIATNHKIKNYVMLINCAEFGGLISNLTRIVSFGPISSELARKHQAVCNVDAAVNLATKPGRTFGEIFIDLQKAYADNGFADQWQFHHQGGSTGYAGRDAFGSPGNPIKVLENQAFAWNPSITGTKSEDTILCTSGGIEVLTQGTKNWPMLTGRAGDESLTRPDILQT